MHEDRDADFSAFVAARWGDLVRSGVFLGCRPEDARDLAQTTLLKCYMKWDAIAAAEDRDAYTYRMLVNCLRDSRRRRWWQEHPTDTVPEEPSLTDQEQEWDVQNAVSQALNSLPEQQRQVVVLRYFSGLSERQTADVLNVPSGTVKSRLSRALARLAQDEHLTDLAAGEQT